MLEPDGAWTGRVVPPSSMKLPRPRACLLAQNDISSSCEAVKSSSSSDQQPRCARCCTAVRSADSGGGGRRGQQRQGSWAGAMATEASARKPPHQLSLAFRPNSSTHDVTTLLGTHAGGVAGDIPQRLHEHDARRLLLARQDMAVVDDHIAPPRRSTTVVTGPVHHHAITHAVAHLLAGLRCGVPGPKRRLGQISVLQMRQRSHCTSVALPPAAWWWWCGDRVRWQRWRRRGWWRDGSRWRWRLAREGALDRELIVDPGVVVPDESPAQCRRIGDKRTHTKPVNGKNRIRFLACGPLQTGYLYLSVNCTLFFFLALLA